MSFTKMMPWSTLGPAGNVQLRVEIYNVFNRVNFAPPSLVAFSGMPDDTAPLASFGQIRSTILGTTDAVGAAVHV